MSSTAVRRLLLLLGPTVALWLALVAVWPVVQGQPLRAELAAWRLWFALAREDSTALGHLAASGSAHNLLCARRLWDPVYFRPSLRYRWVRFLTVDGGRLRYGFYGGRVEDGEQAVYDVFITLEGPPRVESLMRVSGPALPHQFWDCVQPRPNPRMHLRRRGRS